MTTPSTKQPESVFSPLEPDDPRRLGDFELRARLGAGGMGRVYLGATSTGRRLAVKVVRSEYAEDPEFRSRFRREIDAALRVRGRFTASLVDADAEGPRPWLATEYIPGPSLAAAVAGYGPLPEGTVRTLVAGIAEALHAVHRAGVVHRDLKPSNVLLGPDGPCVIDFGIARAADATPLTRSGYQLGTPVFMAPEQVRGEVAAEPADVWALGGLAYFAATGERPFGDGPETAVHYRVVHEAPRLDRCPAYLRPLVEACLDKDPARRPSLRTILEQFPVPAKVRGWLPQPLGVAVATYADTPPGPFVVPTPTPARRGRRSAYVAGVVSFVVVLAAGGAAAVLLNRAQGGGDGATGAPQPGTYAINRQVADLGDWRMELTDIVVGNDGTMTAHVKYENHGAVIPGLTCLTDQNPDADTIEYADGTVVKSTETYCSKHPGATWDVENGKAWTGYAVFPAPTSGQPFTLHWQPGSPPQDGDVEGITLR